AKARSSRSRVASDAWISPAAATRTMSVHVARMPFSETTAGTMPNPTCEELIEAMKMGASILARAGIPFALGGGLAVWARGGPRSEHDVDLMVRPDTAEGGHEGVPW